MSDSEPPPFNLWKWLLSSFRPFEVVSGIVTVITVIFGLMGLPAPVLYVFAGFALFCLTVGIVGHVKSIAEQPTLKLGRLWHNESSSEQKLPQPKARPDLLKASNESTEKPNLVFKEVEYRYVHIEYGILVEGRDKEHINEKMVAVTIPVENEFRDEFKAVHVSGVTAQIFYQPNSAGPLQANRGAWLNNGNRMGFAVSDTNYLIIAFFLEGGERFVGALVREYQNNDDAMIGSTAFLSEDYYRVRVKLISEQLGIKYVEQEYDLEIDGDPVTVTLTPFVKLSLDDIRKRLEGFLKEGNDLLRDFPKEKERTDEDDKKIDAFESRVVKFLKRCPDSFSVIMFLNDVPVVKYGGQGAHAWNWPSLNRLTTRISRIRDMIDEIRRA